MRIAIVNDDGLAVESIRRVLTGIPGSELAWVVENGRKCVEKCYEDPPDLILMDIDMPDMNGVEATRTIRQKFSIPVLIVCSTAKNKVSSVFESMRYGALDVIETPQFGRSKEAEQSREILQKKIERVSKLCQKQEIIFPKTEKTDAQINVLPFVIAIGASTGGPAALCEVLSPLVPDTNAAVVIIQHVDEEYAVDMARWINSRIPMPVKLAGQDEPIRAGNVYLAAGNDHLSLTPELRFSYIPEPKDYPYRPSVNVFFQSLASLWPENGIALILSGMGRDGAQGMVALRKKGWYTIAQDRDTCAVYGMPKAAVQLGGVMEIAPVQEIGRIVFETTKIKRP